MRILHIIGKKWTFPILRKLMESKELRFNEIKNSLGITPRNLSIALKDLEKNNIIFKKNYHDDIPNFSYAVTNYGMVISYVAVLISNLRKRHLYNKSINPQISNLLIKEINALNDSVTVLDKLTSSKKMGVLNNKEGENTTSQTRKYFVPVSATLCGMYSTFCINHGIEHLSHIDILF